MHASCSQATHSTPAVDNAVMYHAGVQVPQYYSFQSETNIWVVVHEMVCGALQLFGIACQSSMVQSLG